jgi:hypothetical protein
MIGKSSIDMNDNESNFDQTTGCESNAELNGEGTSYRNAPMISAPRTVTKRRIRGALVPMPRNQQC